MLSHLAPVAHGQLEIEDACGLRMRTAARFICVADGFQSEVAVIHEGRRYNGRSMRELVSMGADCGARLEIETQGLDAGAALAALLRVFEESRA